MKKIVSILLFFIIIFSFPHKTLAIVDPFNSPNNYFGIHILDPIDLEKAKALVNSSGGDWGYVTLVIQENDRNKDKWQKIFNEMRRKHLIPIVRLASQEQNGGWKKLEISDIDNWINFLNSINWVVKNRYLVIANEPNHASEWGGEVNPVEYANYFIVFAKKAKAASSDFFIMPASLDASAPNDKEHFSEEKFITEVLKTTPDFFEYADGLASHSYPNPNFSGSEKDTGRGSIQTFEWELSLLRKLNVYKKLPIFITETGWMHDEEGRSLKNKKISLSQKYNYAFKNIWNDPKIVAVTPFVLNYQQTPFDLFSWQKKDGSFYDFFNTVKDMPKVRGIPVQENDGEILLLIAPNIAKKSTKIRAMILVQNLGQSIWENGEVYIQENINNKLIINSPINLTIEPEQKFLFSFDIFIPDLEGKLTGFLKFIKNDKIFGKEYAFTVISIKPLFSELDLFNEKVQIIFKNSINTSFEKIKFFF